MTLKKRLKKGELVLGTMVSEVRNPNITYLLAHAGFDYIILDNEHGSYSSETIANIIAAAKGAGIDIVVRIPEIRRETILKPLDAGASGLLVPQVHTVEQAKEVLHFSKYPPIGDRGAAIRRPHNKYAKVNAANYLKQANDNLFIALQAESILAVENAAHIAALDGVDCLFTGPFDLSVSLGIPGETNHPKEIKAIKKVIKACKDNHKAAGILMFDQKLLENWIREGVRFAAYSSDISMLADMAAQSVKEIKSGIGRDAI